MIIKIPKSASSEELFQYFQDSRIMRIVNYIIDSKYRKAVNLTQWLRNQVENPDPELEKYALSLKVKGDYDHQMHVILKEVKNDLTYIGDYATWKMAEYWQTANETFEMWLGDCEDGAILMYVIARLCGVPESRLNLFAGNVYDPFTKKEAGHCWLAYKPIEFPTSYVFLDWCYYYDFHSVLTRNKFVLKGKTIYEYQRVSTDFYSPVESQYHSIWFGFNEDIAFRTNMPKWLI